MAQSSSGTPKYLMCARALALASGLGAGLVGCAASLTPDTPRDAAPQTYDGAIFGIRPYDGGCIGICGWQGDANGPAPYDGGVLGSGGAPRDAAQPLPYDGGAVGLKVNPDAAPRDAGQPTPYDGGFFGVQAIPQG